MSNVGAADRNLLYASPTQGVHDLRFIEAALEGGFRVGVATFGPSQGLPVGATQVFCGGLPNDSQSDSGFALAAAAFAPDLVHAGPLGPVTDACVDLRLAPVLGVSWGFDLLDPDPDMQTSVERSLQSSLDVDHVLVDCVASRDLLVANGRSPAELTIIPWGVDLDRFRPSPRREPQTGALRVVSVRSLEPLYRVDVLLHAAAIALSSAGSRSPGMELTIAGDGSMAPVLAELAAALGIGDRTSFLGRVPEAELPAVFTGSDIYVSTSRVDGSSVSMLQAMACALPCIVTDIPSNREWIRPETGWIVPPGDPAPLAELFRTLMTDGSGLRAVGANARQVVESRADWSIGKARLQELYQSISVGATLRRT